MAFSVEVRSLDWIARAPIRTEVSFDLPAAPDAVFSVLSDDVSWPLWFVGVRRVRLQDDHGGAGALRTVWYRGARVDELVLLYEEPCRIVFAGVSSNVPGLKSVVSDWRVLPLGAGRSRLTVSAGIECAGALRLMSWAVRPAVRHVTGGAGGIARIVG